MTHHLRLTDGYAREVTVRYARNFAAKTMKLRVPVKKDQEDWWSRVMRMLERPYRLVSRV
jgi:xeroderma pigmentosum group C-complementing protein